MRIDSTGAIRLVACCSAVGLVIASAGFGGVYAYRVGIEHSPLLAALSVTFAIALELCKPLAIQAVFISFGRWSPVRGLLMALLGLVAITYSLTAELSLMAASRGDLASSREHASDSSKLARERHSRAKQELATLGKSRSVGELQAMREGWKRAYPNQPWVLEPELARAKKRQALEAGTKGHRSRDCNRSSPSDCRSWSCLLVHLSGCLGNLRCRGDRSHLAQSGAGDCPRVGVGASRTPGHEHQPQSQGDSARASDAIGLAGAGYWREFRARQGGESDRGSPQSQWWDSEG